MLISGGGDSPEPTDELVTPDEFIFAKIEASRRELLDLGLRNPLLNYRTLRAKGVEIAGESVAQVFKTLVTDGYPMAFLPGREDDAGEEDADNPYARPGGANQSDRNLQTGESPASLQKRLLNTFRDANTSVEETGVNTLFLALGMLRWYEADASHQARLARLVLVPVQLERNGARERFSIRYTGDDLGVNLSLIEKMREDFGLTIPGQIALTPDDDRDIDAAAYIAQVADAISKSAPNRWFVEPDCIALGFFSFNKLLMYLDLNPKNPAITENEIIAALFGDGFREPPSGIGDDDHLDARLSPRDTYHVLDADSSQSLAIHDATGGRNLVIQGPPGTGKSQTITNIIAEAVGRGQRVLFVSEKMAALEVVKRRLDNIGLGAACLELHSNKTKKSDTIDELKRTLELQHTPGIGSRLDDLERTRSQLNDYSEAVNIPVGNSGVTPHDAFGELLTLNGGETSTPIAWKEITGIRHWSGDDFRRKREVVDELRNRLERTGVPARHPFYGCRLRSLLPAAEAELREKIEATASALEGLVAPQCNTQVRQVKEVLDKGSRWRLIQSKYDDQLLPRAWNSDLSQVREVLTTTGRRLFGRLSLSYRRACKQLGAEMSEKIPRGVDRKIALIDAISEGQKLQADINGQYPDVVLALGSRWAGHNTDWDEVGRALNTYETSVTELQSALDLDNEARFSHPDGLISLPIAEQRNVLGEWAARLPQIQDIIGFSNDVDAALREELGPAVDVAERNADAAMYLTSWFERAWYESIAETAFDERSPIRTFNSQIHESRIERFQTLDRQSLEFNRSRVSQTHRAAASRPNQLPDRLVRASNHVEEATRQRQQQLRVLQGEIAKQRRHKPIRRLLAEAGDIIQELKPVFMMSPLSIANYLAPGSANFDLVVFDEASQVRPVDALGSLLRSKKAVVVGDSKQMPPTSFFDRISHGDENSDDEENVTEGIESVLDLFSRQGAPSRTLRWHYRSRHQSLIAVSNREFYDNNLVVFSSPDASREGAGLQYHYLPDTVYDLGRSRTNPIEAETVARAVMEHAACNPGLSLGVAAFSQAQAQAIEDRVETLRRQDDSCEEFFASHTEEPFFVKNLENVQGDERDVIFISVGYGRDERGQVNQNFGPLNNEGGERRLNVLITRAKQQCHVFTNLHHEDITSQTIGMRALRTFLAYAETGNMPDNPYVSSFEVDSPFQRAVTERLKERGYLVHQEVASGGRFVDIAIEDPQRPGRYIIGIECDGASYHSSRSARDRDRLRGDVLRGLGWELHRIWSTDWFRNPERELNRAVDAIELARLGPKDKDNPPKDELDAGLTVGETTLTKTDLDAVLDKTVAAAIGAVPGDDCGRQHGCQESRHQSKVG